MTPSHILVIRGYFTAKIHFAPEGYARNWQKADPGPSLAGRVIMTLHQ
jgi:hypothetical protein